jgi:hypothetical protein
MAQKDEFVSEFMGLLAATPVSHPNTFRFMHLMNLLAAFTAMHWKGEYKRLRPSQRLPMLRPPTQVPGHSSYPSGHATQASLIARGTARIIPATATNLMGLAARIGHNRELAGLHYPSDTKAGESLAEKIFTMIEKDRTPPSLPITDLPATPSSPTMPLYGKAFDAAYGEWH